MIITIYTCGEWCLYHCLKQPHAIFLDEKQAQNLYYFSIVAYKPQMWTKGLVSFLNKKIKYACYFNAILKLKLKQW